MGEAKRRNKLEWKTQSPKKELYSFLASADNAVGFTHPDVFKWWFKFSQLGYSAVGRGAVFFCSFEEIRACHNLSMKSFLSLIEKESVYIPLDIEESKCEDPEVGDIIDDIIGLLREPMEKYNPRKEFVLVLSVPDLPELNLESSMSVMICDRFGIKKA